MFELKGIKSDNKHPPATTWSAATMEVFNNSFNTQEQPLSSSGKQPEANGSKGLHRVLPETFIWLLSHAQQLCKQPCSVLVRMVNKRPWPRSGCALSFSLTLWYEKITQGFLQSNNTSGYVLCYGCGRCSGHWGPKEAFSSLWKLVVAFGPPLKRLFAFL